MGISHRRTREENTRQTIEVYARQVEYGDILAQKCIEIRLRAERKAGLLLRDTELQEGRPPTEPEKTLVRERPFLADMGINKNQSYKWQKIACIPEKKID